MPSALPHVSRISGRHPILLEGDSSFKEQSHKWKGVKDYAEFPSLKSRKQGEHTLTEMGFMQSTHFSKSCNHELSAFGNAIESYTPNLGAYKFERIKTFSENVFELNVEELR